MSKEKRFKKVVEYKWEDSSFPAFIDIIIYSFVIIMIWAFGMISNLAHGIIISITLFIGLILNIPKRKVYYVEDKEKGK